MRILFALIALLLGTVNTQARASVNLPVGKIPKWDSKAMSSRKQVFLYYANETPSSAWAKRNRETLLHWLKDTPVGLAGKLSHKIKEDEQLFTQVVKKEVETLQKGLLSTALGRSTGAVWITNELVGQNTLLVLEPGGSEIKREPLFDYPRSTDPRMQSAPLMDVQFLKAFLKWAKNRFEAQDPLFSMVVKSHGAPDFLLVQLVSIRAGVVSQKRFQEEVVFEDGLLNAGQSLPDESVHPKLEKTVGMLKTDFFNVIEKAADVPHLSVLFLESCKSGEGLGHVHMLPRTIDLLYTSDHKGLRYESVDYSQVLSKSEGRSFGKGLQTTLETLAKANQPKAAGLPAWLKELIFFLPLTIMLARWIWSSLRKCSVFSE